MNFRTISIENTDDNDMWKQQLLFGNAEKNGWADILLKAVWVECWGVEMLSGGIVKIFRS